MKISICGSMMFYIQMREAQEVLEKFGHEVIVPMGTDDDPPIESRPGITKEQLVAAKIEYDFIRRHFRNIESSDAILILNYPKDGIEGYIGGNTFLEMGYAFGLNKKIFTLYAIPEMQYAAEMHAMQPVVLDGDVTKIA